MSEYNNAFDFNAIAAAYDMPAPVMDQSGTWNAALHPQSGLMEGGTAAQPHARLDLAPFEGARSNGYGVDTTCAVCLNAFHTTHALDNHAKEASHQAYKCKCGTGFKKHSALRRHIDTKDAPKTFACTLCADKFTRKDKLKDHCRHYHKVTVEGLRNLFDAQEPRPRGAAPRRLQARVPAAASSGSAPNLATARPPALAPAPAGSSDWSSPAATGPQGASFLAGPFVSTGLFATTNPLVPANSVHPAGPFVPAADPFAAVLDENISGTLDDSFGGETWSMASGGFNF